jgi:hypothetical protein
VHNNDAENAANSATKAVAAASEFAADRRRLRSQSRFRNAKISPRQSHSNADANLAAADFGKIDGEYCAVDDGSDGSTAILYILLRQRERV